MYPVLFRIGDLEITSFGVLVVIGALVGIAIFRRELNAVICPLMGSTQRPVLAGSARFAIGCCGDIGDDKSLDQ